MTQEEKQEVIRVCGPNFNEKDIPTYIRNRDSEDLKKIIDYQKESLKLILGKQAYCIKCSEPIKGDEDSICGRCI